MGHVLVLLMGRAKPYEMVNGLLLDTISAVDQFSVHSALLINLIMGNVMDLGLVHGLGSGLTMGMTESINGLGHCP